MEIKLSDDPGCILTGYDEALLYANEYATQLAGWPKAVLVSSSSIPGELRQADDVIAVDWDRWVPREVIDGFVVGLTSEPRADGR